MAAATILAIGEIDSRRQIGGPRDILDPPTDRAPHDTVLSKMELAAAGEVYRVPFDRMRLNDSSVDAPVFADVCAFNHRWDSLYPDIPEVSSASSTTVASDLLMLLTRMSLLQVGKRNTPLVCTVFALLEAARLGTVAGTPPIATTSDIDVSMSETQSGSYWPARVVSDNDIEIRRVRGLTLDMYVVRTGSRKPDGFTDLQNFFKSPLKEGEGVSEESLWIPMTFAQFFSAVLADTVQRYDSACTQPTAADDTSMAVYHFVDLLILGLVRDEIVESLVRTAYGGDIPSMCREIVRFSTEIKTNPEHPLYSQRADTRHTSDQKTVIIREAIILLVGSVLEQVWPRLGDLWIIYEKHLQSLT